MDDTALLNSRLIGATTEIVASFVGKNPITAGDLPGLIASVFATVSTLGAAPPAVIAEPVVLVPAVPIKKSVGTDAIVCLDCGAKFKMLKRHLRTEHALSTEEYRLRWDLPFNYPMVAPAYSARRSDLAKEIGLGTGAKGLRNGHAGAAH